ncbi:HTH-type transcriptional repressor CytR [compost metagenome]
MQEQGISVPDDVSVIGFDDIQLSEYLSPSLTTIRQPMHEAGSLAAHLLFQRLGGAEVNREYKLTIELIERNSVKQNK